MTFISCFTEFSASVPMTSSASTPSMDNIEIPSAWIAFFKGSIWIARSSGI